jgi:antirestriction protein ArdC
MTDKLLEIMDKGEIPWRRPWGGPDSQVMPMNLKSKKFYNGANRLLLMCAPFRSNRWLTFKQAKELGGSVKKGEKSWPCVFWKFLGQVDDKGKPVLNDRGQQKQIPMLRSYRVFNLDQTEGVKAPPVEEVETIEFEPISRCEVVVRTMPHRPRLEHGPGGAYYQSSTDSINMPDRDTFETEELYYSVLFHEMIHSTGHPTRLKRPLGNVFGSDAYAREELIAELGASFVCGDCRIEQRTVENSAAYLQNWSSRFKKDKKLFVTAAGKAAKAADWILGRHEQTAAAKAA